MRSTYQRREFLQKVGEETLILGGFAATSRGYQVNETIHVGCIGTGGRCRMLMRELKNIPGVRMTAICDVWDKNLEAGKELADPKAATWGSIRRPSIGNDFSDVPRTSPSTSIDFAIGVGSGISAQAFSPISWCITWTSPTGFWGWSTQRWRLPSVIT